MDYRTGKISLYKHTTFVGRITHSHGSKIFTSLIVHLFKSGVVWGKLAVQTKISFHFTCKELWLTVTVSIDVIVTREFYALFLWLLGTWPQL